MYSYDLFRNNYDIRNFQYENDTGYMDSNYSDSDNCEIDYPDSQSTTYVDANIPMYKNQYSIDNKDELPLFTNEYSAYIFEMDLRLKETQQKRHKVEPRYNNCCSICLDTYENNIPVSYCSTHCGNIYHKKCVIQLKKHNILNCPLCRKKTNFSDLELQPNQLNYR